MLTLFLCGEFLLHIPYWRHFYLGSISYWLLLFSFSFFLFYLGSFSYTSLAPLIFMQGVFHRGISLKHSVLAFYVGSFSYTSHAGFIFIGGVYLTHPMLDLLFCREFLSKIPCFFIFFIFLSFLYFFFKYGEFLLHIPYSLHFYVGSFYYTSHADFVFMYGFILIWRVSLTYPMLASFLSGEFLLHIPCWLRFYLRSFSYTSRASFTFILGVSLTHPMLALPFFMGSFYYTSQAGFIFIRGVSLTHPVLYWFVCKEFLLHTPCRLFFFFFFFMWGVSLTQHVLISFFIGGISLIHPLLASFLFGEFLLHIPCWLHFYLGSFSYTSRAVLIFMQGVFHRGSFS